MSHGKTRELSGIAGIGIEGGNERAGLIHDLLAEPETGLWLPGGVAEDSHVGKESCEDVCAGIEVDHLSVDFFRVEPVRAVHRGQIPAE